jgi:hypothetical protein
MVQPRPTQAVKTGVKSLGDHDLRLTSQTSTARLPTAPSVPLTRALTSFALRFAKWRASDVTIDTTFDGRERSG